MRIFLIVLWFAILPIAGWGENVALVIGNSDYRTVPTLPNPVNDANAVALALQQQGFDVTTATNMTRAEMLTTLRAFRNRADRAEVAMVYYAGHGMEIGGRNYLIPVDARIADERDARLEMIEMQDVLVQLSGARRMKMIVLDACRDNPFVARMQRENKGRNVGRGLAIVNDAGADTLIAYAAAAGEVTPDGQEGGNSPFTRAFLNALKGPPADVRLLLGKVRDELRQSVPGAAPFVYSSLGGRQYILNANSPAQTPAAPAPVAKLDENALLIDFATAEISDTAAAWDVFLEKYRMHADHTLYILARRSRDRLTPAAATGRPSEPRSGTRPAGRDQVASLDSDIQPPTPVPAPAPAVPALTRKEAMLEIQRLLKLRNCYPGRLDGLYGPQTARGLATLSDRAGVELRVGRSDRGEDLEQLISRLAIIDDVKCPAVKVVRKPPAKSKAPSRASAPARKPAAPAPAPAPQKKRPQPGSTVFKNPPNYCPQFGMSKGCIDGTPTNW